MARIIKLARLLSVFTVVSFLINGCGYSIKYNLNNQEIAQADTRIPLQVKVALFSDNRDITERNKAARKANGYRDVNDYTYDKEFHGNLSESISEMVASHLRYAGVITEVDVLKLDSEQISKTGLDSLRRSGADAVMVGKIESKTRLSAKLVSTSTHETVWEDTFDLQESEKKAMPGLNTEQRKYQVAVDALREVVNEMVKSLSGAKQLAVN